VLSEVWDDDREVPGRRDHRVSTVSVALARGPRMSVHISHDLKVVLATEPPERSKPGTVEDNDAGVQAVGVEIVIEHKTLNTTALDPTAHDAYAEKKRSTLALPRPAAPQLGKSSEPDLRRTGEAMSRREEGYRERPYSHWN
jgi:hypothetical protein